LKRSAKDRPEQSATLVRKLVDKIVLVPNDADGPSIDLHGNRAGILQVSLGQVALDETIEPPSKVFWSGGSASIVGCGIGFEPMTFKLSAGQSNS
jgi:hypothetical protein